MTVEKFNAGLEKLKVNEDYWTFDNDYKYKYKMLLNAEPDRTSQYSWEYLCDIMDFMLSENERIFKNNCK